MTVTRIVPPATRAGQASLQPRSAPPPSRQNPPAHRTATPQLLRIFQAAVLVIAVIIGAFGVPLATSSDGLMEQATIESQYEALSEVSVKTLRANELGLATMVSRTNDPGPFRNQMDDVAAAVVKAADALSNEDSATRLSQINVAVQAYSRTMEQAIALLQADPKQTTQAATLTASAQKTLDERVLSELGAMQQEATQQLQFVPSQVAGVFRIVAGLCALVIIAVMVAVALRTRRVVNIGLGIGLVAIIGAIALSTLVPATAASDASAGDVRHVTIGREQLLRARASELNLVLDPTNSALGGAWTQAYQRADESFRAGSLDAHSDLAAYQRSHANLVAKIAEGKPDEISKAAADAGARAAPVTRAADQRITAERTQVTTILQSGTVGVTMVAFGLGALGLVTAVGSTIGIQQRLREFR